LLLAATAVSLTLANTTLGGAPYINFWETHMGPASLALHVSIKEWINEVRSLSSCAWSAQQLARPGGWSSSQGHELAAAHATRGCECGQSERANRQADRSRSSGGGSASRGSHS
jgi:hypothetical protein